MDALKAKLDDICNAINLDETTKTEAWKKFVAASEQFVIEGDKLSWLVCSLYATCCLEEIETVDGNTTSGSFISLAKMLQVSNISLYNFFSRLHQWCEMVAAPTGFSAHVHRLEQRFIVSSVVFGKYRSIFAYVFDDLESSILKGASEKTESDTKEAAAESCSKTMSPPLKRSRKSKALPCTSIELFEFGWTVFLIVKAQYRQISDNLLNCYHLALSCIDWLYSITIHSSRRDLVSSQFRDDLANSNGASSNAGAIASTKPGSRPVSIVHLLCQRFSGVEVEALAIRQYHWQPALKRFFESRVLITGNDNGIIDSDVFTENKRSVASHYDEYVLKTGDFDERILMAPDAHARIGSPPRGGLHAHSIMSPNPAIITTIDAASIKSAKAEGEGEMFPPPRPVPGNLNAARKLLPMFGRPTPLTARERLGHSFVPSTPVCAAATTAACLLQLASSRPPGMSDVLSQMLDKGGHKYSVEFDRMATEYRGILEKALIAATSTSDNESAVLAAHTGVQRVVAMSTALFFRCAELVLAKERHILALKSGHPDADLAPIATQPTFLRSLYAISAEVILSAFCPTCAFPWGLKTFSLAPHDLLRVIELLVRADDHLPRETVKHLNYVEESVLECYLWRSDSLFWRFLEKAEVPSYEEVCLEKDHQANGQMSGMQSPQNPANTPLRAAVTASSLTPSLSRVLSGTTSTTSSGFPLSPSSNTMSTSNAAANNSNNNQMTSSVCRALFAADDDTKASDRPQSMRSISAATSPTRLATELSAQFVAARASATKAPQASAEAAAPNANKRGGSLALIFRKLYRMVALRLAELCNSLGMGGRFLQLTFTFVEHCFRTDIALLKDRHVDQILLCAIYMMSKILQKPLISFSELLKWYRKLPHANSTTYRSILLYPVEGSPCSAEKSENKDVHSASQLQAPVRSSTRQAAKRRSTSASKDDSDGQSTEKAESIISLAAEISPSSETTVPTADNRGDIVLFYNVLFVPKFQDYAIELGDGRRTGSVLPNARFSKLSPLPCRRSSNGAMLSPRHLSSQISIQPLDTSPARFNITSSADRLVVQVNGSPSKDLQAINSALKHRATMSATRRLLGDVDSVHMSGGQGGGSTSSSARQLLDSLGA